MKYKGKEVEVIREVEPYDENKGPQYVIMVDGKEKVVGHHDPDLTDVDDK